MKNEKSKIIIPDGAVPSKKELAVAMSLIKSGKDVVFIPKYQSKTPDIEYDGKMWEIKRPEGNGKRTIQHQLQRAVLQSCNVIIDTSGTKMILCQIISRIKDYINKNRCIKCVMIVTKKTGEILTLKK